MEIAFPETLATAERDELFSHEETIERGLQTFVDVGTSLMAIRDRRLYRENHGTFEDYCRDRWDLSSSRARRLIYAAESVANLQTVPTGTLPETERQVRPLTKLEPEQQREAWQRAVETAPDGKVTGAHVQRTVDEYIGGDGVIPEESQVEVVPAEGKPHVHVAQNSGNNEWYTPPEYLAAARGVMGHIDLDPASSPIANQTVAARTFFSAEDDGLSREWKGRVWMNPPYAGDLIGRFSAKLCAHLESGDITEAIVLVNNATETQWFQQMAAMAGAICFPKGRVRFLDPEGNTGAPLQGQAILYFGENTFDFDKEFSRFGFVR